MDWDHIEVDLWRDDHEPLWSVAPPCGWHGIIEVVNKRILHPSWNKASGYHLGAPLHCQPHFSLCQQFRRKLLAISFEQAQQALIIMAGGWWTDARKFDLLTAAG